MKLTRYLAAAVTAGLLVCAATACGSSDGDKALTKSEWVKQANAICTKGSAETKKLSDKLDAAGGTPSDAAMSTYVKAATANSIAQITKIKALGYPEGDEDQLDKALVTWQATLAAMAKNPDKAMELSSDKKVQAATTTLKDYGLSECAGG